MNIRDFNDHLFHLKKAHFLAYVKVAAETIGAPIPEVNFEGCIAFDNDLAHIHLDQNKICVLEQYLKQATDEELRDTATHEVTHLLDETPDNKHDISWVKVQNNVKTASWIREHTNNETNQFPNHDNNKSVKFQKNEINIARDTTNRTLEKLRTLYESGGIEQNEFFEKISNELVVVNRIIVRIQSDYESGKMGQRVYLDKLNAFQKDKKELEAILNPPEPVDDMPEQLEQIEETPSEPLESTEETPPKPPEPIEETHSQPPESPKEEIGQPDNAGKCDICGKRAYLPFECKRCYGIFCDVHHLPENHSCSPISIKKIIEDIKKFEDENSPKSEKEVINDKINEVNRIIVRIQSDYESGKMGQRVYLDKLNAFQKDKKELEAILNPPEPVDDMPEQLEQIEETPSEPLESTEETPPKPPEPIEETHSQPPESPKEEIGQPDNAGKCDICGKRAYLPFECRRCLGTFCDEHRLPENHSCITINKIIEDFKDHEKKISPKTEDEKTSILTKIFGKKPLFKRKHQRGY